jgi:putative intracellular protease/amidase
LWWRHRSAAGVSTASPVFPEALKIGPVFLVQEWLAVMASTIYNKASTQPTPYHDALADPFLPPGGFFMVSSLMKKNIAILVCSGFEEKYFVHLQRAITEAGAKVTIISRDTGVTNGWTGNGWGLSYPVDTQLSETLAVDYDGVVIPDGSRHTQLLLAEPHGKRVVNAFMREAAPALVIGSAVDLIAELGHIDAGQPEAITLNATLVTAPADADLNEMVDNFASAVANYTDTEEAA